MIYLNSVPLSKESYAQFSEIRNQRLVKYSNRSKQLQEDPRFKSFDPKLVSEYYRLRFKAYFYDPRKASELNFSFSEESARQSFQIYHLFTQKVMTQPFDLYQNLSKINDQVLIIHGDADPIPFENSQNLNLTFKHSSLLLLKDCGHFSFIEKEHETLSEIKKFL